METQILVPGRSRGVPRLSGTAAENLGAPGQTSGSVLPEFRPGPQLRLGGAKTREESHRVAGVELAEAVEVAGPVGVAPAERVDPEGAKVARVHEVPSLTLRRQQLRP